MKVKDTLEIDKVYSTLKDKLMNFIHGNCRYTGSWQATEYIKTNFPSWYYDDSNATPFEEVMLWCEEAFGNDWIWNWHTIYFKHEQDKTLFMLRWA